MTYPPGDPYGQQGGYQYDPYQQSQPYSGQPYSGQPYSGQPYSAQPYVQQPYVVTQSRGTNTMAILALIFGIVVPLLGIIFGHVAKSQIKNTGEDGDGLATAGLIIGYIHMGLWVAGCCVYFVFIAAIFGAAGSAGAASSSSSDGYVFLLQWMKAGLSLLGH